jgi:hypothetical protein
MLDMAKMRFVQISDLVRSTGWRARSQMKLVSESGRWRIEGPQKERARVTYARLENERLMYRIEGKS